jgi:hypothetical protein
MAHEVSLKYQASSELFILMSKENLSIGICEQEAIELIKSDYITRLELLNKYYYEINKRNRNEDADKSVVDMLLPGVAINLVIFENSLNNKLIKIVRNDQSFGLEINMNPYYEYFETLARLLFQIRREGHISQNDANEIFSLCHINLQ